MQGQTLMWHWILQVTGTVNNSWTNFWGGFGADIGEFAGVGAVFRILHHSKHHCQGCGSN